ncbi:hypothetical protein H7X87_04190 [Acetobacteraceae bacterium]|nr:hypothetical protein [Candidatus Parcubacteria bacterium]
MTTTFHYKKILFFLSVLLTVLVISQSTYAGSRSVLADNLGNSGSSVRGPSTPFGNASFSGTGQCSGNCGNSSAGGRGNSNEESRANSAPTCTLSVSPTVMTHNDEAQLSWTSSNTKEIGFTSTNGDSSSSRLPSGSIRVSPDRTTTYTGTFYGSSGGKVVCRATLTIVPPQQTPTPAPTPVPPANVDPAECTVRVSPNTIVQGGSATLVWSSARADTFYISNVGYVNPNTTGSAVVSPSQTTSYSGTATNSAGARVSCTGSDTLSVQAAPQAPQSGPPIVSTDPATNIAAPRATLRAVVNPNRAATMAWFRYSANDPGSCNNSFGTAVPASGGVNMGSGAMDTRYSQGINGLTQNQTYYYCIIAQNSNGMSFGTVRTFFTQPICPPSYYSCSGNNIMFTDSQCTTSVYAVCAPPASCSSGMSTCVYPNISGSLTITPPLIRIGGKATVSWNYSNAQSCTVSGTNGDSWNGTSGSYQTSAIVGQTIYTARCDNFDPDSLQLDFSESKTLSIIPSYKEI